MHDFFRLTLLESKIAVCAKNYPLVRFECCKGPREFMRAKLQNSPLCAEWIALKFCIDYEAFLAQLLVKKFDRVRSGHGAMTS